MCFVCTSPSISRFSSTPIWSGGNLQVFPRRLNTPRLTCQICETGTVLARIPSAQRAWLRHLVRLTHVRDALLERRQQRFCGLGRQVLVVVVVDLHHGSIDACAKAFHFDEGKEAIGGSLALLDAELLLDRLDDDVAAAAAELAGCLENGVSRLIQGVSRARRGGSAYRRASLDMELAHRCPVVHSVEGGDLVDTHGGHIENARHLVHDADAGKAMLPLAKVQQRHHSRLLVLGRVPLEDLGDDGLVGSCELERDVGVVVGGVAVLVRACVISSGALR